MLREIGEQLGISVKKSASRQDAPTELTEAEKWVDAGYMPGGRKIPTKQTNEIPITVREMMVNLKDLKGKHNA